jgi:hypothetical protein
MKIKKLLLMASLLASAPTLHASTLCFVNALPRSEKIDFLYKGQKIRPYPFEEGGYTLCLTVPPGPLPFTVEVPLKGSIPLTATPESGKHKTAIVFEKIEADPETQEVKRKHAVLQVPQSGPPSGKPTTFRVAYVGGTSPLLITTESETFELAPNTFSEVKTGPLVQEIRTSGSNQPFKIAFEDPTVFTLVIFPGSDGTLKHSIAYESIYN